MNILKLPLCYRCLALFLGIKVEIIEQVEESELKLLINKKLISTSYQLTPNDIDSIEQTIQGNEFICHCCLNSLHSPILNNLIHSLEVKVTDIIDQYKLDTTTNSFGLLFEWPSILDGTRIASRMIIKQTSHKTINLSTVDQIFLHILESRLSKIFPLKYDPQTPNLLLFVKIHIANDNLICNSILPDFKTKKIKRKYTDGANIDPLNQPVSRPTIDRILVTIKDYSIMEIQSLAQRYLQYYSSVEDKNSVLSIETNIYFSPCYLYGRYNKFARDVPQSPWNLTLTNYNVSDLDLDERKGRYSIEEILGFTVKQITGAKFCHLHACGREDIDVRCLGNGRPFALEIIESKIPLTQEIIQRIETSVNLREGLNDQFDIFIKSLTLTNRSTWEKMQVEAEEKKKGYTCLVWTKEKITKVMLSLLEKMSVQDLDQDNTPCLQIVQKTPLRVLHRRSLMDRVRFIYEITTLQLNEHCFIMKLVTSAGAYVKEFVHSDLGRTTPSISSILKTQAEILQLDVCKLYDSFDLYSINPDHIESSVINNDDHCDDEITWNQMKKMKIARQKV